MTTLASLLLSPGTLLESLAVSDLTVDGGAVARHEGRVVFLDRGLPGDVVAARVAEDKKRVIHAAVTHIQEPSPHARPAWCPHFSLCGACLWQDMAPEALLAWKQRFVRQALARIGGAGDVPVAPVLPSPRQRAYRNKMAYAFVSDQEGLRLGLRQRASRAVVEVTECGMQPPEAMRLLALAREEAGRLSLPAWDGRGGVWRFLVIRVSDYLERGKPRIVVECVTGPDGEHPAHAAKVRELLQHLLTGGATGVLHTVRMSATDVPQGEHTVYAGGDSVIREKYGDIPLEVPVDGFMQTNTGAARELYARVVAAAGLTGLETVWDVYCGVGGIALSLAPMAASVHGFELGKSSVAAARRNCQAAGLPHCRFTAGDVSHTLMRAFERFGAPDVMVVDPPRSGMDARAISAIAAIPARRLIYVSCDAATQARDLARLRPVWKAVEAFPVDMFPHTPHIENILVCERDAERVVPL